MYSLYDTAALGRHHLLKQVLGALGRTAAQVAFTDLGAYHLARPSQAETFRRSFMGLDLIFPFSWFAWHNRTPLTQNSADATLIRGYS